MTRPASGLGTLAMARTERTELAQLLASLTPDQWTTRSLCEGWTASDVAVHVISYDSLSWTASSTTRTSAGRWSSRA